MLDNCEHLIDACAKTADALLRRCPRVHLVATSREPLGITGETIYRVPSLSLPASRRLCGARVFRCSRAVRGPGQGPGRRAHGSTRETVPVIVSVCRRLDGMPLAIELAAARLRSRSLSSPQDRLDQRFRLLTGGSRTALARQQTLRAPSTGAMRCSTEPSGAAAPAVGVRRGSIWKRPKRSAASSDSKRPTSPTCSPPWWTNPGRGRASRGGPALPAAGDGSAVRRGAPPRGGRGRGRRRRGGPRPALPVRRRGGGPSSEGIGPGQLVRQAGRRSGKPVACGPVCVQRLGRDRAGPAPGPWPWTGTGWRGAGARKPWPRRRPRSSGPMPGRDPVLFARALVVAAARLPGSPT